MQHQHRKTEINGKLFFCFFGFPYRKLDKQLKKVCNTSNGRDLPECRSITTTSTTTTSPWATNLGDILTRYILQAQAWKMTNIATKNSYMCVLSQLSKHNFGKFDRHYWNRTVQQQRDPSLHNCSQQWWVRISFWTSYSQFSISWSRFFPAWRAVQ